MWFACLLFNWQHCILFRCYILRYPKISWFRRELIQIVWINIHRHVLIGTQPNFVSCNIGALSPMLIFPGSKIFKTVTKSWELGSVRSTFCGTLSLIVPRKPYGADEFRYNYRQVRVDSNNKFRDWMLHWHIFAYKKSYYPTPAYRFSDGPSFSTQLLTY